MRREQKEESELGSNEKEKIFTILEARHIKRKLILDNLNIDLNDEHVPYILAYLDSHPDINEITFDSKLSNNALSLLAQHNRLTKLTSLKPPGGCARNSK